MRPPEKIQKYHDLLDLALREVDTDDSCLLTLQILTAYRDLLCWLLEHPNDRFERIIFQLEEEVLRQGYTLEPIEW